METPSVVEITAGHFRVLGRNVHLNYVKEQLISQRVSFDAEREEQPPAVSVDILADSLYIQDQVQLPGIQTLKLYTRKIITPIWRQVYDPHRPSPLRKSNDGYPGIPGPQVEIYADVIQGSLRVISNGGDGFQDKMQTDVSATACTGQGTRSCNSFGPIKGKTGTAGPAGGDAGKAGDGGDSGIQRVYVNTVEGSVELRTCKGNGAPAPRNGQGGNGGRGGEGAKGRNCEWYTKPPTFSSGGTWITYPKKCRDGGQTTKGSTGDTGAQGPLGGSKF
ncbi:hypothetical protein OS493_034351 [Desmophyllum pertusum]|uniref:Uncharacterized protein n=1 Tax=Desmophyllum pertusum TaxID=174260 RepID=A0A9X0CCW3_9CNID|nr:hypothetical protein OS493_034351 [Desmophyllum pertusum]